MNYKYIKRIISVSVIIVFAVVLYIAAINQKRETINKIENDTRIQELKQITSKLQYSISNLEHDEAYDNEYTGTIPPFIYTANIIEIDVNNKSLYGITSNKDTYSGLMRYDFSNTDIDLNNIILYNTYNIKCKPLIRDKEDNKNVTPYVEVISIEQAKKSDELKLNANKEELSRYIEFKLKYELKSLDEIIEAANIAYYKWSDKDIKDYQEWILSLGYTEDVNVKSNVKTLDQLKDEQ